MTLRIEGVMNLNLKLIALILLEAVFLISCNQSAVAASPQGVLYYQQDLTVSRNAQNEQAMKFFREGTLHMKAKRYKAAIEAFKNAITWGQNFSEAYLNLAAAYFNVERYEEAAEACTSAINIKPAKMAIIALAHLFRGKAYTQLGRHEQAIQDFDELVRLDHQEASLYLYRAWTNLYLARGDKAATDARYYLGLKGWRDTHSLYMIIVAHLGFRQARRAAPANEFLKLAMSKIEDSAWPYPIIRYFHHEITAQDLLGLAKDKDKMTEARTYIGIDQALSGHSDEALAHLNWVKDNGNKRYFEYQLALSELSRIASRNTNASKP